MSPPVAAAWVTGTSTVLAVVVAALLAVWRIRAGRAYDRRIRNLETLQDRTAELARATRAYGLQVRERTSAGRAEAQATTDRDNLIEAQLPDDVKAEHRNAEDLVAVAATRVEDRTIVALNAHWRSVSWRHSVDPKDVTAAEELSARDWFDRASAQALASRNGKLAASQRAAWQKCLADTKDDSNDTDPTR